MPRPQNLGLSITNPLVLYRALVATKKIKADPAQHRLALQLQKLYFRLKDYAPEVEYRYRLEKIERRVGRRSAGQDGPEQRTGGQTQSQSELGHHSPSDQSSRSIFSSLLRSRLSTSASSVALIRTTPLHNSALAIDSPQGMLLYGEVGRGKSMLLDLLYTSLPSRKKQRWHFTTFMLDIYRRIEAARLERLEDFERPKQSLFGLGGSGTRISDHEHVVLRLAKETISESPILFLDEFQMPDRTSSKLINSFFTAFFHLGGVLVASSNRMPEELSKAAGTEFGGHGYGYRRAMGGFFGRGWGPSRASEGEQAAKTDFGLFLEVVKARCEVWEMEGDKDWRREDGDLEVVEETNDNDNHGHDGPSSTATAPSPSDATDKTPISTATALTEDSRLSSDSPPHYHIKLPSSDKPTVSSSLEADISLLNPSQTWTPTALTVYARPLRFETTHHGILKSSFDALCATYLGPADYVSLCSTFHTLILTDVPVLTLAHKNEARRFITLLDALYEARCRLLIEAAAPPDKLFFPETTRTLRARSPGVSATLSSGTGTGADIVTHRDGTASRPDTPPQEDDADNYDADSIISESFSEMYQDSTAPFRPNVSSYSPSDSFIDIAATSNKPSFTASLRNPGLRSVLADEDADFGPTYGNGRGRGISDSSMASADARFGMAQAATAPDFTSTAALTGEDERFAYKRARSRLWEMCGRRWWDERLPQRTDNDDLRMSENRARRNVKEVNANAESTASGSEVADDGEDMDGVMAWWRPVARDGRLWEQFVDEAEVKAEAEGGAHVGPGSESSQSDADSFTSSFSSSRTSFSDATSTTKKTADEDLNKTGMTRTTTPTRPSATDSLFRHDASPYRSASDPPPKFEWYHAWGIMRWGKKAGEWGKGVDAINERRLQKERRQQQQQHNPPVGTSSGLSSREDGGKDTRR